jgi:hypothetical protein
MEMTSAEFKKEARAHASADTFQQGVNGLLLRFRTMYTSDASAASQRRPETYPEMGLREQSVLSRALRTPSFRERRKMLSVLCTSTVHCLLKSGLSY